MKTITLIFTDMDGSLLDHYSYSHAPADKLLLKLEEEKTPVIPCTSKTFAELLLLRDDLNNNHPFIVENGAAVFIPENYFNNQPENTVTKDGFWIKKFTRERSYYQSLIDELRPKFDNGFITFSNCTTTQLSQMTGLSEREAKLAADRSFGEPVAWLSGDEEKKDFIAQITARGATVLQGGRFLHISGDCDKGKALRWLTDQFEIDYGLAIQTIALGDSGNDIAMLEAADSAVIIRSPVHGPPEVENQQRYETRNTGPKGWVEGVKHFLHKNQTTNP